MRILFLGTGAFGVPALNRLRAVGHDVVTAISQPDRPAGRGLKTDPTPIRLAAENSGVPHVQLADVNVADQAPLWRAADLGVVVAFGQKIGPHILNALPLGCVNIHASLLPRYRGAAPYQRAILNGDAVTGVTVFRLNARWDAGEILAARETAIGETETADELHDRLALLGAELIVETCAALAEGRACPRPQEASLATRAPKLTKAEGVVDWSAPAAAVVRRIHGLWSWPAAACRFASRSGKAERVLLARARVGDDSAAPSSESPPGAVRGDLSVQTGRGTIRLLEIKPAGGKLMSFEAFANGRRLAAGDRFGSVVAETA